MINKIYLKIMEAEEEKYEMIYKDKGTVTNNRKVIIILSCINDVTSIHTKIINQELASPIEEEKSGISHVENKNSTEIIDINKSTRGLTVEEINDNIIDTIIPNINNNSILMIKQQNSEDYDEQRQLDFDASVDNTFGLLERGKYQKLTKEQIKFLRTLLNSSELSTKQISARYGVSLSLISKIKRQSWQEITAGPHKNYAKVFGTDKYGLSCEILSYLKEWEYTLSAKDVAEKVSANLHQTYSVAFIREFMKNELKLTYKRVKPRPNNIDFSKIRSARVLFAVKFTQAVTTETLVINIDESSINRNLKNNYSWSMRGEINEAKNSPFVGSLSLVTAICSNGWWITMLTNETIDSTKFIVFIENLNWWLIDHSNFNYSNVLIILDNWSIHKSKETLFKLKKINWKIIYLPAYSPMLAPVEMYFGILKAKLRRIQSKEVVKLNVKFDYSRIVRVMKEIRSSIVKKLFRNLYWLLKSLLE